MSSDSTAHPAASKWDRIYAERSDPGQASPILSAHIHLLPAQGNALDLACGLGANALLLAESGLDTQAWDISPVALKRLDSLASAREIPLRTLVRDIESCPPEPASFDVIVVSDFLYRPICNAIAAALKPGGLLFYSTWSVRKVSSQGPSNPDFLLQPNELLRLFPHLQVRCYREDGRAGDLSRGDRDRAHLIAQAPQ